MSRNAHSLIAVVLAGLLLGVLGGVAYAEDLKPGDSAPPLRVKEFIKGQPVAKFEPGKVYVVEFWSTTCVPCRIASPHLSELQKKYQDVIFIGVNVFENHPEDIVSFVEGMGSKMDYTQRGRVWHEL